MPNAERLFYLTSYTDSFSSQQLSERVILGRLERDLITKKKAWALVGEQSQYGQRHLDWRWRHTEKHSKKKTGSRWTYPSLLTHDMLRSLWFVHKEHGRVQNMANTHTHTTLKYKLNTKQYGDNKASTPIVRNITKIENVSQGHLVHHSICPTPVLQ